MNHPPKSGELPFNNTLYEIWVVVKIDGLPESIDTDFVLDTVHAVYKLLHTVHKLHIVLCGLDITIARENARFDSWKYVFWYLEFNFLLAS